MNSPSRRTTLLLLSAVAVVQQSWYVRRAVVPAQDAVDVVCVAQRIEREGLAATIRAEPVPPLFPALVAATHSVASRVGLIEERNWASPPQWVAAAALVCAVIPVFLLTERLVGRGSAVVASVLFIALPSVARLGADGIGDAVHLCLVAWAAWLFVAERRFVAGLCIAAAMLIRIEAVVLPLAALMLSAGRSEFRAPRFLLAVSLCVAPYLACGVTSPTAIVERLRGGSAPTEEGPLNSQIGRLHGAGSWTDAAQGASLTFGRKDAARSSRFHGLAATLDEFVDESLQAFSYVLPPLVVVGLVAVWRGGRRPADRLLTTAVAVHFVLAAVMAYRSGYLSARHFAMPVVLTLPYAAIGLAAACRRLAEVRWNRFQISNVKFQISSLKMQTAATAAFVVASLIAAARPTHESREAHRRAAAWLERHAQPLDAVLDQQGFTALYSGRPTYRFDAAETAFADSLLAYTLVERADLEADTPRGASLRKVLGEADEAVVRFAAERGRREHDVLIFTRRF